MNPRAWIGLSALTLALAAGAWRVAAEPPANPAGPTAAEPAAGATPTNAPAAPPAVKPPAEKQKMAGAYERKVEASIFPDVPQKNPQTLWLSGFRFGSNETDAVYVLLECSKLETKADRMFVWSPALPKWKTPDLLRATPVKNVMVFRAFEVPLAWGDYKGAAKIEIQVHPKTRGRNCARADVTLSRGAERVRFELGRQNLAGLTERAGYLPVLPLEGEPRLAFEVAAGGRVVTADIHVGEWRLLPGSGMENAIRVDVLNASSQTVDRVKLKADPLFFINTPAWTGDVRRLPPGQTFRYRAEINLGGPFGLLQAEKTVSTPAEVKP